MLTAQQQANLQFLRDHLSDLADVPLPASGKTWQRWSALRTLARQDLSLARLAEGHLDARAVLAELERDDLLDDQHLWAVWAAQPAELLAIPKGSGWRLRGAKQWCSGSTGIDRALVTATAEDGVRLFVVDPAELTFDPESWRPLGMQGSASHTADIDCVVEGDATIGAAHGYVSRPGFGHGGVGVAACWLGGAQSLIDDITALELGDHGVLAELALGRAQVDAALSHLERVAFDFDDRPRDRDLADRLGASARAVSAEACRQLLDCAFSAVGSDGLCHRPTLQQRLVDLTVYVSQLPRHRAAASLVASEVAWS